jgi:PAT family beta-lactamase induction signal transducer AmpG
LANKLTTTQSLKAALKSWRLGAVTLLSLSSGLPLGIVLYVVPSWMEKSGVDIKTIGVLTLAQAPYAFKFLWSPLLDRYSLPGLGRKRGWILLGQIALALAAFALATQAGAPSVGMVGALTLLFAFASASQDIAIDAYTVDTLRPDEQGLAVGARTAMYRIGMWIAGGAISFAALKVGAGTVGWGPTLAGLGVLFLLLAPVAVFAPEPEVQAPPPKTMREAVWEPFTGFFQKPRAMEIVAFLLLYKFADNLAVSLVRPFLLQAGYGEVDVGIASTTVGLLFTMAGTFVGGYLTNSLGVGRALWLFGFLQSSAGLGYALVASTDLNRPLMYAAMALEAGASGMGTGAFSVLLIRLTQKRFSATQYALFSSVFALGRTIAGPIAGALADAIGWRDFFLFTVVCGIPGLAMLQRFVPFGTRELPESLERPEASTGAPVTRSGLLARGLAATLVGVLLGAVSSATLSGLKAVKEGKGFSLVPTFERMAAPGKVSDWIELASVLAFGLIVGFGTAAYLAARRGLKASGS